MITVLDTETTGFEPGDVVEIATVNVSDDGALCEHASRLVHPKCEISFEAMAVHHITNEDVANEKDLDSVLGDLLFGEYVAAHNAAFDSKFLPQLSNAKWICTYRCAHHIWPDAPKFSNQVIRYWLGVDVSDMPTEAGVTPHRALYDTWCTAKILAEMLKAGHTADDLVRLSSTPIVQRTIRFGKYRDRAWTDVPRDYLSWIIRQSDMDADVVYTARHHLQNGGSLA